MKNQAELMIKKPPTKLKTQVNIYNKKDNSSTSVDPKSRFATNVNQNNDPSLKKKSPYSPRNHYVNKPYIQGRNDKIEQVKKQLAVIKTKAAQLNNDQAEALPLLKSKSSSEYKLPSDKYSLPLESQSPKLQTQQLKSRVMFYEKQIADLQSKIVRLQTEIKEKENSKVNFDYKLDTQRFVEISNLKQELSAAGYRQRSLTDQKKVLIQNQLNNEKKIEQLQLLIIKQRHEREEFERHKPNALEESRATERRLIDRHTEIIRAKEKEIIQLKNIQYESKERIIELENQLYKLKLVITQKPFPHTSSAQHQKQKQVLRKQIQKLNTQLSKQYQKKQNSASESRSHKSNLEKQISNYLRQINCLVDKNQQLQRTSNQHIKTINQLQTKCSKLQLLKFQQSKRLLELTTKHSKLQEELLLAKTSQITTSSSVSNNSHSSSSVSKSMQSISCKSSKYEDVHHELSVKNSMIQKLHATNKSLQSSVSNLHQMEKKLKMNEALLSESNGCIMKMRLQMMNKMYANQSDSK